MTKPTSSPRPFRRAPTPSRKRRFLLVGAVLIVLGIFALQSLLPSLGSKQGIESADADAVVDGAIAGMQYEGTVDAAVAIAAAEAALNASEAKARERIDLLLAEAEGQVAGLDAEAARLPAAPPGYLPGQDVSMYTEGTLVRVDAFEVPTLPGDVDELEAAGISWEEVERFRGSGNSSLPETGVSELDAYRSAVQDYAELVLDVVGSQDDGTADLVWMSLNSLGVPAGERPQPGDLGAAFPDEETAEEARRHADYVLDVADANLADFDAELDKIVAVHEELLVTVDFVLATTPAIQNQTMLQYEDELQKRLGAVEATRAQAHQQVASRADGATAHLQEVRETATAGVHEAVDEEVARIHATAVNESDRLDALADAVRADAERGIADIENGTDETLRVLAEIEAESGRDMGPMAEIVEDASARTIEDIRAEADMQEKMLREASLRILTSANGRANELYETASGTVADLQAEVDAQLEEIERARAFSDARVDLLHDMRRDAHQEAYDLAVKTLQEDIDAHVQHTLDVAWDINQQSQAALDGTYEIVLMIRSDSSTVVPEDVDYIWELVEDYRQVPTPEREEAAQVWEDIAITLLGDLDGVAGPGGSIDTVEQKLLAVTFDGGLLDQVEQGLVMRGAGV